LPDQASRSSALPADAAGALALAEALGDALVLVERRGGRVGGCTAAFRRRVPEARPGIAVEHLESACPGLLAAVDGLAAADGAAVDDLAAVDGVAVDVLAALDGAAVDELAAVDGAAVDELAVLDGAVVDETGRELAGTALRSASLGPFAVVRLELSSVPDTSRADALRDYLRARDDLFSRSRTISVSEMATTLAHEINQPVGTVVNLLRGASRRLGRASGEGTDEAARALLTALVPVLDQALDQALYTSSVIARIRDFTRARRPARAPVAIDELVRRAVALLDWLFEAEGCRIELCLPSVPTSVTGDETMLQQVLVNLLRNGVEAMRDTPRAARRLDVSATVDDARLTLAVGDRGHGLGEGGRDLFVPFATAKPDGMGVGLNICRSFVELHGGRLWLAPGEEGGCTAHVELPLDIETPARPTAAAQELAR